MGFLGLNLKSGVEGLVNSLSDAVGKFVTTDKEKEQLHQQMSQITNKFFLDYQDQLTERLRIDMKSDSWLSKNIRPMTLIFTTLVVSIMALTSGNLGTFKVQQSWIDLFKTIMVLQYTFYFGSRGIEKITKMVATRNKGNGK